jgi:hypothetical protein
MGRYQPPIGLNLTLVVRDSQDPSLIVSHGGAAAITAAGDLLSVKVKPNTPKRVEKSNRTVYSQVTKN